MKRFSGNFLNLGTLYESSFYVRISRNSVNLGNFYANSLSLEARNSSGHGYFHDGSMFIAPSSYLRHDVFETRMKFAAQLLSTPVRQSKAMEDMRSHGEHVIVIDTSRTTLLEEPMCLVVRNARNSKGVSIHASLFDDVTLALNGAVTQIQDCQLHDRVVLSKDDLNSLRDAVRTFRGTLIDGILQPNVRLGNGLDIQGLPNQFIPRPRSRRQEREAKRQRAVALRAQLGVKCIEPGTVPIDLIRKVGVTVKKDIELIAETQRSRSLPHAEPRARSANPSKLSQARKDGIIIQKDIKLRARTPKAKSPPRVEGNVRPAIPNKPNQEELIQRTTLELQAAERRLKEKEEELQLKEETLRRNYRAWSLEQRLVKQQHAMSSRPRKIEERHPRYLRTTSTNTPYTITEKPQHASFPDPWLPRTGGPIPSSKSSKAVRHSKSARDDVNTSNRPPKTPRTPSTIQELRPQSDFESSRDASPLNNFKLDKHTSPAALATLRSRIAIPGRRRRGSRPP